MQATPSSEAIRADLVHTLRRDLIGPYPIPEDADLAEERLTEEPSRWYMTGYLVPAEGSPLAYPADEDPDLDQLAAQSLAAEERDIAAEGGSGEDDGPGDEAVTRRRRRATTMGLSVALSAQVKTIDATIEWGDYRAEPPIPEAVLCGEASAKAWEQAQGGVEWQRVPRRCAVTLDLEAVRRAGGEQTIPLAGTAAAQRRGGGLELYLVCTPDVLTDPERPPEPICALMVMVVNRRAATIRRFEDLSFSFQVRLTLTCAEGFKPTRDLTGYEAEDPDLRLHDLHYRDLAVYGLGRNAACDCAPDADGVVRRVWTEPMPTAKVEKVAQNPALQAADFPVTSSMRALASAEDLTAALTPFAERYADWIETQAGRIDDFAAWPRRQATAADLVAGQRKALYRMRGGIALLATDATARKAFRVMNEAVSSALVRRLALIDPTWRPFQLAFILLNLRGLSEPTDPEREIVDLLFFPTGGGKTEAYLGLAAYTIALRRLRAPGLLGSGVSVIMRYTLRLLTLDQLGRAAGVICALELMRKHPDWQDAQGQPLLGPWPIEIGLWIGSKGSPNRLGARGDSGEDTAVSRVRAYRKHGQDAPAPIRDCPWCGHPLERTSFDMKPSFERPVRMTIECRNIECAFTGDNPLPILAVDEEIYNRLPAFVIATLDKFAQLPLRGAPGAFFGHVDRVAEGHRFYGADQPGQGRLIDQRQCLPPPDLIVQDELHLISGPLGTVAGVYEAAIDALATRMIDDRRVRPKIVASTATVRRAQDQIRALFDRHETAIFPAPGIDRRDSWFAITRAPDEEAARLYLGIAAIGEGPRVVYMRALISLLNAAQAVYERTAWTPETDPATGERKANHPADPYMTALCYFNALRELGGARRIVEDEVRERTRRYGQQRIRRTPQDQPFADRSIGVPVELTSRISTDEVATAKRRLETPIGEDGFIDVALATNMISVGLDITRLGLMLVQGQPKLASEYIQATSRVGRDAKRPGLVVVVLNAHRPRDKGHYEGFAGFHQAFYREVEATSVTPWSARAQDRALAAALVTLVRHLDEQMTPDEAAGSLRDTTLGDEARRILLERAAGLDAAGQAALGATIDRLLADWRALAETQAEAGNTFVYQKNDPGNPNALLHTPLDPGIANGALEEAYRRFQAGWSMRDVESSVPLKLFKPNGEPLSEGRRKR